MKRILIVEADPAILKGIETALRDEGHEVLFAKDGEKCRQIVRNEKLDLIILDMILLKKHSFDVCRDLRKEGSMPPILILTSKEGECDKSLAAEIGTGSSLTKPFSIRELNARVKTLLRRSEKGVREISEYNFDNIHIDFTEKSVVKDGKTLKLSLKELELMKYFIEHAGKVLSHDMLLNALWGEDNYTTMKTVDRYIISLRERIEEDPNKPKHILTVPAGGYKFII